MLSWAQKKAIQDISYSSPRTTRLLEVGFGSGEVLELLSLHDYAQTAGLEVSWPTVKAARIKLQNRINTHILLEDGSVLKPTMNYDTVLAFEVLEHQENPQAFLQKLPGSRLYLSTPNVSRWFVQRFKSFEYWDYPPNHLWRFCTCPSEESIGRHKLCSQDCFCCTVEGFTLYTPTVHIKTLLHLAGYSQVEVQVSPVQAIDIVRAISGKLSPKKLSSNYDEMRSESSFLRAAARNILLPPAFLYAKYLSHRKYQGGNLYIKAQR